MATMASSFSLHRIAQLYSFNGPWLRKQLIGYLSFSVLTALLYIWGDGHSWQGAVSGTCHLALGVMFILSPLVFIKGGDARIVERLIPASAAEKFTFHVSYLVLMIPVCYLFPWLAEKLCAPEVVVIGDIKVDVEHGLGQPAVFEWIGYLSAFAALMTCLYCVVHARTNRALKGTIFAFVVIIGFSIIGSIFAAMEAFMIGFNEGAMGMEQSVDEAEVVAKVTEALNDHITYTYVLVGIFAAYALLMLGLTYRSLSRRNL